MSISTIYRVSVDIPEAVYREFGHTAEYEIKCSDATKGNVSAGQNACSDVEEWAEFYTYKEAQACQKRLMDMNYHFAAKLPEKDTRRENQNG